MELPPWKIYEADVSSISPSSERIEELWGAVGLYESVEELFHWWHEIVIKLMEQEAFIDPMWIECTQLKDKFLFKIFAAFCVLVV